MYRANEAVIVSDNYNGVIEDGTWYKVKSKTTGEKGSEKWFDEGYFYSIKLTDIKGKQDVAFLAKKLSDKFKELSKQ